jgi:hypothetical protein
MKASFSKDNHKIVVKKQLSAIQLIIDDKICAEKWPNMCIRLLDLNDYDNIELMNEVIEDGIKL